MKKLVLIIVCSLTALFGLALKVYAQESADMQAAKASLYQSHGAGNYFFAMGEQMEITHHKGDQALAFEGQGWYGGDINKLWLKSTIEYDLEDSQTEAFELQALLSQAVHPFWDLQMGVRYDHIESQDLGYATIGMMGETPYWVELDGQLFLSDQGDVSYRFEAEYEFRLTQNLILQPRAELDGGFSEVRELNLGSGVRHLDLGLRLRYEITPQVAPYVGVSWEKALGDTEEFTDEHSQTMIVAGLRFWF